VLHDVERSTGAPDAVLAEPVSVCESLGPGKTVARVQEEHVACISESDKRFVLAPHVVVSELRAPGIGGLLNRAGLFLFE
jgi:hypothetical protein